jgi:serine/threonine protein kinase
MFGNNDYSWQDITGNLLQRGTHSQRQVENNVFGSLPRLARDLVKRMLTYNPKQRITGEEILKHEWLRDSY